MRIGARGGATDGGTLNASRPAAGRFGGSSRNSGLAAQSDPNDPRVYVYLADTYRWLGMDADSKQAAERAKQLDPNAFEILR